MERWLVRKKRTGRKKKTSTFDNLPEDIKLIIFKKLNSEKAISKAMCVSHKWRNFIIEKTLQKEEKPYRVKARLFPYPFMNLERLIIWCSEVMRCGFSWQNFISTCNGLLLFCLKDGDAENVTHGVYHYYVMNHITKQCVAILHPAGTISGGYSYASLAYDPHKSRFFNIMRFQGRRHINVFSSKNGSWKTLTIDLPKEVSKAHWVKKSVYANGAIYRLSRSGHIIMFNVDQQESIKEQALAIRLPPACLLNRCHWDICAKRNKIWFVMSLSSYLFVFELMSGVDHEKGVTTYSWKRVCNINDNNLRELNFKGKLLSFHPYHGVAFFKLKRVVFCYYDRQDIKGQSEFEYKELSYDYIQNCGLPLLECAIPFSCTLPKEHPRVFWWLPIVRDF